MWALSPPKVSLQNAIVFLSSSVQSSLPGFHPQVIQSLEIQQTLSEVSWRAMCHWLKETHLSFSYWALLCPSCARIQAICQNLAEEQRIKQFTVWPRGRKGLHKSPHRDETRPIWRHHYLQDTLMVHHPDNEIYTVTPNAFHGDEAGPYIEKWSFIT